MIFDFLIYSILCTVIESDEVVNQSSSSSSEDSVETDELPDLVEIDRKEKPTEKEANVEVVDDPEEEKGKIVILTKVTKDFQIFQKQKKILKFK